MPQPPSRPRRRVPLWLRAAAVLGVVALLWSGGWLIAAREAGAAFDAWVRAEADRGRAWTCPGRQVVGYPFALALGCDRPTFRGEVSGHIAAGSVEGLQAGVGLPHPMTIDVGLTGPLYLRAEDDAFDVVINWAGTMSVTGSVTGAAGGASVAATTLAVTVATPGRANLNLRAARFSGSAAPDPASSADAAFAFTANGVSFPTMPEIPGLDGPIDAAGQGVLVRADLLTAPTVSRLEAWRAADGMLRLGSLALKTGSFAGKAKGTLQLDGAHRPAGRLATELTGFEPIAKRLGIPVAGVQIGGLLAGLLGGQQPSANPGAIALPLILAGGRLSIGPFDTGARLDPLY